MNHELARKVLPLGGGTPVFQIPAGGLALVPLQRHPLAPAPVRK